jgi:hypothetical protein
MGAARNEGGSGSLASDDSNNPSSSDPEKPHRAGRSSGGLLDLARNRMVRWVLRGRVRLGDGSALEAIAPEDLEAIRRRFPRRKFFIFGHPRSGTTLLARLIRSIPTSTATGRPSSSALAARFRTSQPRPSITGCAIRATASFRSGTRRR